MPIVLQAFTSRSVKLTLKNHSTIYLFIANEPAERRREAGEAAAL